MSNNPIRELKIQAQEAWNSHFNKCEDNKVWSNLNATIEDIKYFETAWKLRYIQEEIDKLIEGDKIENK